MRSALLLLGGLVLLGAGVAVIALEVPGRWVIGPALIVVGVLVKIAGFLLTGDAAPSPTSGARRTVTTLGPPASERTRGGVPMTRSTRRGERPRPARAAARTARSSEVAREAALARTRSRHGTGRRRAS
ncbi:hypothetical protein ACR9E3_18275 [Actinomycetospora sp. C-140]